MQSKTLIAVLTVLAGALAAAPAGAATGGTLCPPGVTDATYCAVGNQSGLTSKEPTSKASENGSVNYKVHCEASAGCSGTLYFEELKGGASSTAHTAKSIVYGSAKYSIKSGKTVTLKVTLNSAGRKALEKTGKLKVTVVSIAKGVRSVIGHLTIKGHKAAKKKANPKHTTHTTTKPGFTG